MRKDFDGKAWATTHGGDFQDLIRRAREKARGKQKGVGDEQGVLEEKVRTDGDENGVPSENRRMSPQSADGEEISIHPHIDDAGGGGGGGGGTATADEHLSEPSYRHGREPMQPENTITHPPEQHHPIPNLRKPLSGEKSPFFKSDIDPPPSASTVDLTSQG